MFLCHFIFIFVLFFCIQTSYMLLLLLPCVLLAIDVIGGGECM